MQFNVGDKVFVRKHTEREKDDYPLVWVYGMDQFEGKTCEIERVLSETEYALRYGIYRYNFVASSLMATVNQHYDQF